MTETSSHSAIPRRRVLIYTLGVALVLALAADKYSFGEFESAKLVPEAAIRVLWQVVAGG